MHWNIAGDAEGQPSQVNQKIYENIVVYIWYSPHALSMMLRLLLIVYPSSCCNTVVNVMILTIEKKIFGEKPHHLFYHYTLYIVAEFREIGKFSLHLLYLSQFIKKMKNSQVSVLLFKHCEVYTCLYSAPWSFFGTYFISKWQL